MQAQKRGYLPFDSPSTLGSLRTKFREAKFWRRGSCGRFRTVLSGVEGNRRPKRLSLRDSIVLFDSRAFEPRTKLGAPRSRRASRAVAQLSSRSLCLDCVRSIGDLDRPMSPRNRNHRSISGCKHRTWLFCPSTRPNCGLAQDKISLREILEAGGVEPPSEKPCNSKTTCLSRSDCFTRRAQSGQDALPASPMILPPHYGPKRDGQPTV